MKTRCKKVLTIFTLIFAMLLSMPVFAEPAVDDTITAPQQGTGGDFNWDDEGARGSAEKMLESMFLDEAFNSKNINAAVQMATPLVLLSMTLTMFVLIVAFYFFIMQTSIDLLAILLPFTRSFLVRRTQKYGTNHGNAIGGAGSGDTFGCLSDAAMEILGYASEKQSGLASSTSGSEHATSGSKLLRYAGKKTTEVSVLIVFVMIFFTPLLRVGIFAIFDFFTLILQGMFNLV